MVTVGVPVLLVTLGTAAILNKIVTTILFGCATKFAEGAGALYRSFKGNLRTYQYHPPRQREEGRGGTRSVEIPRAHHSPRSAQTEEAVRVIAMERVPLPANAAAERNEALQRFISLTDQYIIEPWILKNEKLLERGKAVDPLFKSMIETPDELRSFLRSIALWQFGLSWDQGESRFVKSKMLPPSTPESISREIQALRLDRDLEAQLLQCLAPVDEMDEGGAERQVETFQRIATHHESLNGNRKMLLALSLRLLGVLKHKPKSVEDATIEKNKHCYTFAVGMNEVVANSFIHVAGILEGVMRGIKKTSPENDSSCEREEVEQRDLDVAPEVEPTGQQVTLEHGVTEMITVLSEKLREHYSTPLYAKHKAKWEGVATKDQVEDSPTDRFLRGILSDVDFLAAPETQALSTQ